MIGQMQKKLLEQLKAKLQNTQRELSAKCAELQAAKTDGEARES